MLNKLFKTRTASLLAKSAGIMNVFTQTVNQLTEVNREILGEQEANDARIAALTLENKNLISQKELNERTITKITELLN
jgi:hypothetical protein